MIETLSKPPSNWRIVKIPEVAFFQEGPGVRKWQFENEGVKLLNVGNINNGVLNLSTTKLFLSEKEAYGKYAHFLVDAGDLLIACSGIVLDNFHNKICFAEEKHLPLALNTSTMRFKSLDKEVLDLNFLKYFLQTIHFNHQLGRLITGSAQLNFGPSHIKQIKLLLPPLTEQQKIAAILDTADDIRQNAKQLLERYTALGQSLFLEMFGDPIINPKGFSKKKLGKICEVGSSKRVFVEEFVGQGVPFYRGTEVGKLGAGELINPHLFITQQHYESLKEKTGVPKIGDLLLPSICDDGRIYRVDNSKPFYFKDGRVLWIKVCEDNINSVYLQHYLRNLFKVNYSSFASGSTFAELKIIVLKGIDILLAPKKLQNQFAERIQQIEVLKQQAQASLTQSEALFESLLQRAFTGKLTR